MRPPPTELPFKRFETDPVDELRLAAVRRASAIVAATCAVLVLLSAVPFTIALVCVVALLVSLGWLAAGRAAAQRALHPGLFQLALYEQGLLLIEGASERWVAWADVTDIHVDEDRLDIVVQRASSEALRIEPRYQGVEIHALMDTLRNAWRARSDD